MLKRLVTKYFELFSDKNITLISDLLAKDVELIDWEISVFGRDQVVKATKNIFDSVKTINVKPIKIYEDKETVIAELEIVINSVEKLLVVDIITYDVDENICSIIGYKR